MRRWRTAQELGDVAIAGRLDGLEDRPLERAGAGIDPVEDQRVEVEVQVERTPEALRDDDRATAPSRDAGALSPFRLVWPAPRPLPAQRTYPQRGLQRFRG